MISTNNQYEFFKNTKFTDDGRLLVDVEGLPELIQMLSALTIQIGDISDRQDCLTDAVCDITGDIDNINNNIDGINTNIDNINDTQGNIEGTINDIGTQQDDIQDTVNELNNTIDGLASSCEHLQQKLDLLTGVRPRVERKERSSCQPVHQMIEEGLYHNTSTGQLTNNTPKIYKWGGWNIVSSRR